MLTYGFASQKHCLCSFNHLPSMCLSNDIQLVWRGEREGNRAGVEVGKTVVQL